MFETMNDDDANEWRRTKGASWRLRLSRRWMYRRKDETDRQWQQRIRTVQISEQAAGSLDPLFKGRLRPLRRAKGAPFFASTAGKADRHRRCAIA